MPDIPGLDAAMLVKRVCRVLGGGGGGTAKMARGGGERVERIGDGIAAGLELVSEQLKEIRQGYVSDSGGIRRNR